MDLGRQHDGSSDEESEMEWEEVEAEAPSVQPESSTSASGAAGKLPSNLTAADAAGAEDTNAGVEITLRPSTITVGGKVKGKGKGRPAGFSLEAQQERANRQELHKIHTMCLLISGHVRNGWINDRSLQARLMSKVPLSVQNRFHDFSKATHPKATDRSRLFEAAMKNLMTWWHDRFWFDDTHRSAGAAHERSLFDVLAAPHSIQTEDNTDMKRMIDKLSTRDRIRLMMPFCEEEDLEKLNKAYPESTSSKSKGKASAQSKKKQKAVKPISAELGELIRNSQSLAKRAVQMVGTRDMSAQLFTCLCRALDIPARLVCSLPCVDHRSASKAKSDDKLGDFNKASSINGSAKKRKLDQSMTTEDSDDGAEFEEVKIPSSVPRRAIKVTNGNASDASSTGRRAKKPVPSLFADRKTKASTPVIDLDEVSYAVPTFWTEVYNRSLQEWVTVDVVRNKFRPRKGEMDNGRLFYVVAYEVDQYIKDITPRYARSYAGRTLKMRIQNRRKDDPEWFDEAIQPWMRPFSLGREMKEDEELARSQEAEPMPTVLEGFKNHPRYVLERHLKREEVLIPKTKQLGLFRGEPVFPRSAVIGVKSSENWMREGRTIKDGEQPLKNVKQRAVTINRRRAQEMAMQEGQEPLMQGLYSRHQTEMVIPPPIKDGKVPKNSYGNIDLFAPHMLPKGAVHLPHRNIRKVARDLGIDHAEAITGFEFHKRRAVPTVSGIVVAKEHEEMLLEAYDAQETAAVEKEIIKKRERALKKWKKLIVGLRVRSRIQGEYRKNPNEGSTALENANGKAEAKEGKSQFQLAAEEEEAELAKQSQSSKADGKVKDPPSTSSSGFITNGIHPEIPGGAVFLPLHHHEPAPLDDGPQLDLTMLDLPPMPIPDPAAIDYASPPPDLAQQTFNAEFDYPPQSELDDMAIDVSRLSEEAKEELEKEMAEDVPSSRSSSSMSHHSDHVDLDEFTLRDPEDIAKGAPEIGDEETETDGSVQGGFIRDNEEDQEMEKVKSEDEALDAKRKHHSPESDVHEVDFAANGPDQMEDTAEEAKPVRKGRSTNGKPMQELSVASEDDERAESPFEEDGDKTDDYKEDTPPARTTRPTRSTRASAGKRQPNGAAATSSPSTPAQSTRRSGRNSSSKAAYAMEGTAKPATRATRASARNAKKEDSEEEEEEEVDKDDEVDEDDETEEEAIQITSKRSTRATAKGARATPSNGRSTRSSRRSTAS